MPSKEILTVGYEGLTLDAFTLALTKARVSVLADIRAIAHSRRPRFAKTALRSAIEAAGIRYLHIPALGNPKAGREAAWAGDIEEYQRIFRKHLDLTATRTALEQLVAVARSRRTCLMCMEANPPIVTEALLRPKSNNPRACGLRAFDRYQWSVTVLGEETEEIVIVVKAVPQPSKKYGETVCCAGLTRRGEWRRLYPIRYRRLGDSSFSRWQWVSCRTARRSSDRRMETWRVTEDSIRPVRILPPPERPRFMQPLVRGSVREAAAQNASLTLVRPIESEFAAKRRGLAEIEAERQAYQAAARQTDLFDEELSEIVPCPFAFRLRFRDADGWHEHQCEDWETEAAFWNLSRRYDESQVLQHLNAEYNQRRPGKGLVLALGNMAARPQTWLLLGILALPEAEPDLLTFPEG
jgi:hypothetical protein